MPRTAFRPTGRTAVKKLRTELEALAERCRGLDPADERRADLGCYLCIRIAGYLEQSLALAGTAVCERMAGGSALNFSLSWLERLRNPRSAEIARFVRRFEASWADELEAVLADEEFGGRINALMGVRNEVAHGGSQSVSVERALEYLQAVDEVVDWVVDKFDPLPEPLRGTDLWRRPRIGDV